MYDSARDRAAGDLRRIHKKGSRASREFRVQICGQVIRSSGAVQGQFKKLKPQSSISAVLGEVNMQAREYCGSVGIKHKPIILSHHMMQRSKPCLTSNVEIREEGEELNCQQFSYVFL